MADDAWHIESSANKHRPSEQTRSPHETRLLHELIIQAVTERRVDVDPNTPYDEQLQSTIRNLTATAGYKSLLARHEFAPSDVSTLLDQQHLQRLPTVDSAHHVTLMMATGGPASGKSQLIEGIKSSYPQTFSNAAKINPDDYKPLLADRAIYGKDYADVSHAESSKLAAEIMTRLEGKMAAGQAPNIVMDVVATSEHRMNFAKQAGRLIVVTGVVPIDVAVERSFERGKPDDGRRISTDVVIGGARNVAVELPRVFEHPQLVFDIVNTDVPYKTPSKPVAHLEKSDGKITLKITDPDTFIGLVERQKLNINAHDPEQLYKPEDRAPATIAQELKAYTDRGVKLDFLNPQGEVALTLSHSGVEQIRPLASNRGGTFFAQLAGAATALAGRQAIDPSQRTQVDEHATGEPRKTQNPVPILVPQSERSPQQNPLPIIVPPQNERGQTPPPVIVTPPPPSSELPPERVALPSKIGIAGAAAQLAIGPAYEATLAAANDGSARDVGAAALHGLANSALPGVTDGFKNITQKNSHQNWIDQTLNAGTTATQGTAVGALAVAGGATVAAPVTGGSSLTVTAGSLVVAGVAGVANLGIGLVHDATYVTGMSKQGGVITGVVNMASQLADSKAAHRTFDWVMSNDAKVQHELAVKGIRPNQLTAVDENHDGKITAQETRDYLIQHHVAATEVNSLPAQGLADKLATVLTTEAQAQGSAHTAPHATLSPDMLRALGMAKGAGINQSLQCDVHHLPALGNMSAANAAAAACKTAHGR